MVVAVVVFGKSVPHNFVSRSSFPFSSFPLHKHCSASLDNFFPCSVDKRLEFGDLELCRVKCNACFRAAKPHSHPWSKVQPEKLNVEDGKFDASSSRAAFISKNRLFRVQGGVAKSRLDPRNNGNFAFLPTTLKELLEIFTVIFVVAGRRRNPTAAVAPAAQTMSATIAAIGKVDFCTRRNRICFDNNTTHVCVCAFLHPNGMVARVLCVCVPHVKTRVVLIRVCSTCLFLKLQHDFDKHDSTAKTKCTCPFL